MEFISFCTFITFSLKFDSIPCGFIQFGIVPFDQGTESEHDLMVYYSFFERLSNTKTFSIVARAKKIWFEG